MPCKCTKIKECLDDGDRIALWSRICVFVIYKLAVELVVKKVLRLERAIEVNTASTLLEVPSNYEEVLLRGLFLMDD